MQRLKLGRQIFHAAQHHIRVLQCRVHIRHHSLPILRSNACGLFSLPRDAPGALATTTQRAQRLHTAAELHQHVGPRGMGQDHLVPLQRQIAPEIVQLVGCQLPAQKIHTNFIELVGFVEHHGPHRRQ